MRPLLDEFHVTLITVSTDTVSEINLGRKMHGLKGTMLADNKLKIINQFGLKNQNLNNFRIPFRPGLPIPTTLLIDDTGTVIWKDDTNQYSKRSDPERIKPVLEKLLS